jgi:hypothetical protein
VGWAEGPFPDAAAARRLLFRFPELLLEELCLLKPEPRAIEALAAWPPFQSRGPHLPDWLLEAPLFPTTDGRFLSLAELETQGLDFVPPGAPAPPHALLELEPDGPTVRWLEVLFDAPPRLYREPVLSPEERLRAELGRELAGLLPNPLQIELGEGATHLLFEFEFKALAVVVNRAHRLVQRVLDGRPGALYILVSALASQLLQQTLEEPERQAAERRFHHELLRRLTPV